MLSNESEVSLVRRLGPPPHAAPYKSLSSYVQMVLEEACSIEQNISKTLAALSERDQYTSSITAVFENQAISLARSLDKEISELGSEIARKRPLLGIPALFKENIAILDAPTECGSKILKGYRSPYNATVVERLLNAGAIPIGYTNMDEFAMGSSCEYSAHGITRNPYDLNRVPGGSSGGGAVASALGLAPISLGSDTGGSVRQPAAYCNVYGFKPTYGCVSRFGLVAFGSSLDQISPFARSAKDLLSVMAVIGGHDKRDATSIVGSFPSTTGRLGVRNDLREIRFGVPRKLLDAVLDKDVNDAFALFLDSVQAGGGEIKDIELPEIEFALPAYYLISAAEASSNLARFDGLKYGLRQPAESRDSMVRSSRTIGFGAEVRRRICLGTFVLSSGYYDSYYGKACAFRNMIAQAFARAHMDCDVLLMPTTPSVAFELGASSSDPVRMYSNDILTVPPSLVGLPALSVPMASTRGLPMGVQLIGRHRADDFVLRIGVLLEEQGFCGVEGLVCKEESH